MAIRYEAVSLEPASDSGPKDGVLEGQVEDVLFLGTNCEVNVRCGGMNLIGTVPALRNNTFPIGLSVHVAFDLSNAQVFYD